MSTKFTPGPWRINRDRVSLAIPMNSGGVTSTYCGDEANAHLIAAAPELLAACEALLASHRPGLGQCCKASDLGIAALAKARGEV